MKPHFAHVFKLNYGVCGCARIVIAVTNGGPPSKFSQRSQSVGADQNDHFLYEGNDDQEIALTCDLTF